MDKRGFIFGWYILIVVIMSLLVFLYSFAEEENIRIMILVALAAVVTFTLMFSYLEFVHLPTRMKKKLRKIAALLPDEPAEFLQNHYLKAYKLYVKLSEKRKQRFYEQLSRIREQIEEHFVAEKNIQELTYNLGKTLAQQKKNYQEILSHYEKLPSKVQEKYYHYIIQLKQKLESGKL